MSAFGGKADIGLTPRMSASQIYPILKNVILSSD
jgi:hypothetical protein